MPSILKCTRYFVRRSSAPPTTPPSAPSCSPAPGAGSAPGRISPSATSAPAPRRSIFPFPSARTTTRWCAGCASCRSPSCARSTASPPAPAPTSRSPATWCSPRARPASSSRSPGSAWCPIRAALISCRGWSALRARWASRCSAKSSPPRTPSAGASFGKRSTTISCSPRERACARARSRADEGLRPGEEGDLRLRRQLARGAARSRARPAARRGILRGLSRRRVGLHGEARAALPGQVNAFALEPIEKAPLADLKKLQLERLRWTLQHAYDHVPHYRRKFDAARVKPEDCRSLADLARFPFTTKADLRETYPFGMFAVPMDRIVRIHASSGTTGKPTVVGYSAKDIDTSTGVMARSIRAAGARPGDKVHVAYGYGLFTGGLGAHYGAERLGLAVIPLGGGMTERQVQLIADFKPEIIMVTPSYMLAIADEMERQGIDPAKRSLRLGIFGAEPWTNEMRSNIGD